MTLLKIISATLTSKPKELADAALTAQTPDTDIDPEVSQRYAKEAEQAYKEFMAKQAFVNEYVQKVLAGQPQANAGYLCPQTILLRKTALKK